MKKEILHRITQIAIWSLFIVVLGVFLGFSESQLNKIKCTEISVTITDTTGFYFVEPNDIIDLLSKKGYKIPKYFHLSCESVEMIEELIKIIAVRWERKATKTVVVEAAIKKLYKELSSTGSSTDSSTRNN